MPESISLQIGWPIVALLLGAVFLFMFKEELKSLLNRTTRIGKSGIQAQPSPENQQVIPRSKEAHELLMAIGNNIVLNEKEAGIIDELQELGLETSGDSIEVLIKYLAATQLALAFEQMYNLLFGSQIDLLKDLNNVQGVGLNSSDIDAHFKETNQINGNVFKDWTLNDYLESLIANLLITKEDNKFLITNLGVEFLSWMTRSGKNGIKSL